MQIEFQLLFILKGFFLITIFQKKEENKDTILETKTTFINDLNSYSKQISPSTSISTLGRVKVFQKNETD